MTANVDFDKCEGSGECVEVCPCEVFMFVYGHLQVDEDKCCGCGACQEACPTKAIKVE